MTRRLTLAVFTTFAVLSGAGPHAQTLGAFRWQLQPYCNVLTVTVVQDGSQYHVDGTDDLCGAARRASVVGLAFPNPDGSIGFGLTIVTAPGGTPIHVDATISVTSASGNWRDSAGNSGSFVFTPGAAAGGSPRPIPPGGIAAGTITSAQIAAGAITTAQLAPGSITAAQLAPGAIAAAVAGFGSCPVGQYLRGIQANGSVVCEPIGTPPASIALGATGALDGYESDIAIGPDGLPIISHHYTASDALRVTHCENISCSAARATVVDDQPNAVAGSPSIAIGADGLAIISHTDLTAKVLRVTHCNDAACTSATSLNVTGGGATSSLAIGRDGLAIISHTGPGGLLVTHCNNVTCTASTTVTPDAVTGTGISPSIAIGADGLPIVSHFDSRVAGLRVTHCSNATCSSAVSTTVDDPADDVGVTSSMAIGSDGLALIAHHDTSANDLRVTHCNNVICSSATSTSVDTAGVVGLNPSVAIAPDGLAFIAHTDFSAFALRASYCRNVACTSATSVTIDGAPGSLVGNDPAVAIGADGLPIVSHRDAALNTLRVTKCGSRTCQ